MKSLIEQVTREHALEKASNCKAVNPEDIPVSYEAITAEWLTHVLCKGVPEAKVVSHHPEAPDNGQTNRRRIFISYNDAGNAARLPPSVFCKAAHQLETRLINGIGGLIQGEDAFFTKSIVPSWISRPRRVFSRPMIGTHTAPSLCLTTSCAMAWSFAST